MLPLIFAQKSYNSDKTTLHDTIGLMDLQKKLQLHNRGTSIQHARPIFNSAARMCFEHGPRVPQVTLFLPCGYHNALIYSNFLILFLVRKQQLFQNAKTVFSTTVFLVYQRRLVKIMRRWWRSAAWRIDFQSFTFCKLTFKLI